MAKSLEFVTGVKYKSPNDDDKKKTTFHLKSLNGFEFLECTSGGYVDHAAFVNKGLTGWDDFHDEKGVNIDFTPDLISTISPSILLDLSYEIQLMSSLTEKERKNLQSPAKSPKTRKRSTAKRVNTGTVAKK